MIKITVPKVSHLTRLFGILLTFLNDDFTSAFSGIEFRPDSAIHLATKQFVEFKKICRKEKKLVAFIRLMLVERNFSPHLHVGKIKLIQMSLVDIKTKNLVFSSADREVTTIFLFD